MKQRILGMVLVIALMVGVMPTTVFANEFQAGTDLDISSANTYREGSWDSGNEEVVFTDKLIEEVTLTKIVSEGTTLLGGWYSVVDEVNIKETITFGETGDVHLILMDNCNLTVEGIEVPSGCTLNIYAQSEGANAGTLISTSTDGNKAGIGGAGTIVIHGGNVTGSSIGNGAGIGGGDGEAGIVTIYGGTVKGNGGDGAGIGGGANGDGKVIIYGGHVTGIGDSSSGIGGGSGANSADGGAGEVIISEGTVTGTSANGGAGIGGGMGGAGEVTISGGTVTGTSTNVGAGLGGGMNGTGEVTISGGTVTGTSANGGAGIGGGMGGAGKVTIEEGVTCVKGTGGDDAPGIGSGDSDSTARISIAESLSYATGSSMPDDKAVQNTCKGVTKFDFQTCVKVMVAPEIDATVPTPSESASTTPEEIRAVTLFGSESDGETGKFYQILNDDTAIMVRMMQGPKCIAVMDAFAPQGMELVRTYGILAKGFPFDYVLYTHDTVLEVVLTIPVSLQEEGANYKMICVSENGIPYILDDLDADPTTITFQTNKLYAFGLYKTISN